MKIHIPGLWFLLACGLDTVVSVRPSLQRNVTMEVAASKEDVKVANATNASATKQPSSHEGKWQQTSLLCATLALLLVSGIYQSSTKGNGWSALFMILYISLGVSDYLVTRFTSLRHNGLPFLVVSGVFVFEGIKLVSTMCILLATGTTSQFKELSRHDVLLLGIPAAMYSVLNAFFYIALSETSIADYAITLEMQVVFVGICGIFVFGRVLSRSRALACAGIVVGCCVQHSQQWMSKTALIATWLPAVVALWGSMTTVTCEVVFKHGRKLDINVQNLVMYAWGIALSALLILFVSFRTSKSISSLFVGIGLPEVIAILGIRAFQGLAASRVLKYIDSLAKTIGSALCGPLAMGLAPFFMKEDVTTLTVLAIAITYVASFSFWAMAAPPQTSTDERKPEPSARK